MNNTKKEVIPITTTPRKRRGRPPKKRVIITNKQRAFVKALQDNPTATKKELLAIAGYSETSAITPHRVLESKGVKEIMNEAGLTRETISKYLAEDLASKAGNRLGELTLASKIQRMHEPEEEAGNKFQAIQINIIAPTTL